MTIKETCQYCHYKFKKNDMKNIRCPACCAIRDVYSNIAVAYNTTREKVKAEMIPNTMRVSSSNFTIKNTEDLHTRLKKLFGENK